MDGRVDNLWHEKDVVEENLGKTIEATAETVKKEVAFRLKEDAEVREEELCREGSEAALRYIVDKTVGKMEQDERLEELTQIQTEFEKVRAKMVRDVHHAMSVAKDDLQTARETIRIDNDAEHREMVQLVRDETGAIRNDVASMLGEIETAVKGAEGSVFQLEEKTKES